MKRLVLAVVLAATVSLVSACGGTPSAAPSDSPSASASPGSTASVSTGPAFDPCDGLDVSSVTRAFGSRLRVDTGTVKKRICVVEPVTSSSPKLRYTISYLWFAAGLDQAWKTITAPQGAVTEPPVDHADATRLVTYRTAKADFVTAFVQTGKLIEEINGEALAPYDATKVRAATVALMTELAAKAPRR